MDYLELLQQNGTFPNPESWVDYARTHEFKLIKGAKVDSCPDCSSKAGTAIGQYVHYSNLIRLIECAGCGLIYSDVHLPEEIISQHFESSYKDEQYFLKQRAPIFEQIEGLVRERAKVGAAILDIGGAKGHLLDAIRKQRDDLKLTLNDLSSSACEYAKSRYGLSVMPGSIPELGQTSQQFDLILLIDVIYYEPELRRMWEVLQQLRAPGGTFIIRVPNHLSLIKLDRLRQRVRSTDLSRQTRISGFNPEHIYVFSRSYLESKLRSLGCQHVVTIPSRLLSEDGPLSPRGILYRGSELINQFLPGGPVVTPSMFVLGWG